MNFLLLSVLDLMGPRLSLLQQVNQPIYGNSNIFLWKKNANNLIKVIGVKGLWQFMVTDQL